MTRKIIKLLALALLALFFLPYIVKIQQWDLVVLLLAGLALPVYAFLASGADKKPESRAMRQPPPPCPNRPPR